MAINVQRQGMHNRGDLVASNTYGRPIQVDAAAGARILLAVNCGTATLANLATPTRDGQTFVQVENSHSAYSEASAIWELISPNTGTTNFVVNTVDGGNTNDGTWWWMVLDGTNSVAAASAYLWDAASTSLTPSVTVGGSSFAFCVGSSGTYSGGGALSGTGAINLTNSPFSGRTACYAVGSVPGIGPWPSGVCNAVTSVVNPAGTGATASGATVTSTASLIAGGAFSGIGATASGVTLTAIASLLAGAALGNSGGTLQFQAAGMEFGKRTGLGISAFSLDAAANYRYTVHADDLALGAALHTSGVLATDSGGKLPNASIGAIFSGTTYRIVAIRQADGEAATFRMVAA